MTCRMGDSVLLIHISSMWIRHPCCCTVMLANIFKVGNFCGAFKDGFPFCQHTPIQISLSRYVLRQMLL